MRKLGYFKYAITFTVLCLGAAFWWGTQSSMGGVTALIIAGMLAIMEISLSLDNAVMNATVLRHMNEKWQRLFLTVGILIAVFGMRLIFPILVVAVATIENAANGFMAHMIDVGILAIDNPRAYARHLEEAHTAIASFGGMFLLMVFFTFLFDVGRERYWLGGIEKWLAGLGRFHSLSAIASVGFLLASRELLPLSDEDRMTVLVSGASGIALFVCIHALGNYFAPRKESKALVKTATRSGMMGFIYLEILDASLSFDGVIGAFAITRDVAIIMMGLAIGAVFVRSLTVYLLRQGTLDRFVFLEHGAHYAIGALGLMMILSIMMHVPSLLIGLVGIVLIALSTVSSIKDRKHHPMDIDGS